jgi:hypothetical protein
VRLGLDHVADVLAGPPEILHLDRGTGRAVVAEMADPRRVEGGPVLLQVPHEDADAHHIGQAGAGCGEDGGQVREELVRLLACLSRPPAGLRIISEQGGDEDPAARFHRLWHRPRVMGCVRRFDYLHDTCLRFLGYRAERM